MMGYLPFLKLEKKTQKWYKVLMRLQKPPNQNTMIDMNFQDVLFHMQTTSLRELRPCQICCTLY